jgi:hypothetical protein
MALVTNKIKAKPTQEVNMTVSPEPAKVIAMIKEINADIFNTNS